MSKESFLNILKILAIPLSLLVVYMSMVVLWKFFGFPPAEQLEVVVREYFYKYGLWIVFVSALVEGFLLIGQYFPGGFVIFLGVISAQGDPLRAVLVVLVVCVAFFISYFGNYLLGKYGWHKLFLKFGLGEAIARAEEKVQRHAFNAVFFSYWEPNLSSITATAAGILKVPVKNFLLYSGAGIIFWDSIWGLLAYYVGDKILAVSLPYVILIVAVWCVLILLKVYIYDKRAK